MPDRSLADISVCVCTYRRPHLLDELLAALLAQTALSRVREIIVVDNDPAGSAMPVLAAWKPRCPMPLRIVACPRPNISLARNAALHHATGEWVAFIDDDEIPVAQWLEQLADQARRHQADGVFGPVLPVYPEGVPSWIVEGRFFERRRLATGAPVPKTDVRSGNVLLRRRLLNLDEGPFDPAFGLTGGEDTLLFHRLLDRGARFVWSDEAVVYEPVDPARATVRWLMMRAYRGGQSFIRVSLLTSRGWRRVWRLSVLLSRALLQFCIAAALAAGWWPMSRPRAVRYARLACAQCGKITGAFGLRHQEYKEKEP